MNTLKVFRLDYDEDLQHENFDDTIKYSDGREQFTDKEIFEYIEMAKGVKIDMEKLSSDRAKVLQENELSIITVGYSNEAYALCFNGDTEFTRDLYQNNNFYIMTEYEVKDGGLLESVESIGGIYAQTGEDIKGYVKDYIGETENYVFLDTEETDYLDLPKIKFETITTIKIDQGGL